MAHANIRNDPLGFEVTRPHIADGFLPSHSKSSDIRANPGLKLAEICIFVSYTDMHPIASAEGFQWDEGNARKSADKHGVTQGEAEQVFFNDPLPLLADDRHSAAEPRFHALGRTNGGRHLHVTFTLRANGHLIRVISARDMSRKERTRYEQSP
jgi:uncharacterized DUF497 family protein